MAAGLLHASSARPADSDVWHLESERPSWGGRSTGAGRAPAHHVHLADACPFGERLPSPVGKEMFAGDSLCHRGWQFLAEMMTCPRQARALPCRGETWNARGLEVRGYQRGLHRGGFTERATANRSLGSQSGVDSWRWAWGGTEGVPGGRGQREQRPGGLREPGARPRRGGEKGGHRSPGACVLGGGPDCTRWRPCLWTSLAEAWPATSLAPSSAPADLRRHAGPALVPSIAPGTWPTLPSAQLT